MSSGAAVSKTQMWLFEKSQCQDDDSVSGLTQRVPVSMCDAKVEKKLENMIPTVYYK